MTKLLKKISAPLISLLFLLNMSIAGFGTYKVAKRKARVGRNPRTGEQIQIAASQKVKFLPAKALKEVFNK